MKKTEYPMRILLKQQQRLFNREYWNEQTGGYASNNQACNSFALFLGLVDKERIQRVANNLAEDVKKHDYHLTTGNLCTKYLLEMLTEHGYPEIAYKVASRKLIPVGGSCWPTGQQPSGRDGKTKQGEG